MKHSGNKTEQGFTLIEGIIVAAIITVIAAMAVFGVSNTMAGYKADAAMDQVASQMRAARMRAVSQRHEVQVEFVGTNQMTFTDILQNGGLGPNPVTVSFEGGAQFALVTQPSPLPDTPMLFQTCSPICFGGQAGLSPAKFRFTTSGAFTDTNANFMDGTVFLAINGKAGTARAVTILGATGRVRQYHWDGTQWQE
jgi:prepilin-type N-terminal cleavage/methylation domain-containing protein